MTPAHTNLGTDTTINTVAIDDSYRERKQQCLEPLKDYYCSNCAPENCMVKQSRVVPSVCPCDPDWNAPWLPHTPARSITGCWYYDNNVCVYPNIQHPAPPPEAQQRINAAIKELQEKWTHPDWPVEIEFPMTAYRLALEQAIALLKDIISYKFEPSPPGDTIRDIMEERGLTTVRLTVLLNISEGTMEDLLSGQTTITRDMAMRLSKVLGSTIEFWENREKQYREAIALLQAGRK